MNTVQLMNISQAAEHIKKYRKIIHDWHKDGLISYYFCSSNSSKPKKQRNATGWVSPIEIASALKAGENLKKRDEVKASIQNKEIYLTSILKTYTFFKSQSPFVMVYGKKVAFKRIMIYEWLKAGLITAYLPVFRCSKAKNKRSGHHFVSINEIQDLLVKIKQEKNPAEQLSIF